MQKYKSVEEMAKEWGLSLRQVQYLCRSGKVEGAVMDGDVWIIPDSAPLPLKDSQECALEYEFTGTKKNIFDSSVRLFMLKGFDSVSLRDIASDVGIRQSTIYNHFESKQEILDAIYDFYCYFYNKNRPSLEFMEEKLQTERLIDVLGYIRYDFQEEYQQKMSDITDIILQRIPIDDRARTIAKNLMRDDGIKYIEDLFNKAVEIGKTPPLDSHAMAVFINSVRIFSLFNWLLDSSADNIEKMQKDEDTLYKYACEILEKMMEKGK